MIALSWFKMFGLFKSAEPDYDATEHGSSERKIFKEIWNVI